MSRTPPLSVVDQWWTYQQERFPLQKNGLTTAVFSLSAVGYSLLLRHRLGIQPTTVSLSTIASGLIAMIVLLLFSLQLRIVLEYRDAVDNARHHPEYPVQRGLISLKQLGIGAIACGCIQLGLTLALNPLLLLFLFLLWLYLPLVSTHFFLPQPWRDRPLVYWSIHTLVMPLMGLYAMASEWLAVRVNGAPGVGWFLVVSFFAGMAIEIGRNIRAPKDERPGQHSYTSRWGRQKAVILWLTVTWLTTLSTVLAAMYINFVGLVTLLLLLLLTSAVIVAWRFMSYPVTAWAQRFELVSGIWAIAVYLALGVLPVIFKILR